MDEPTLNSEQKNEVILLLDDLISLVNRANYSNYFMAFITSPYNQEIGCNIRANGCSKCMKFNSISAFDCSKCWHNWYITENSNGLFPTVTNNDILIAFGNNMVEQKKRDSFSCYRLLFKAEKEKSKQILINCFSGMKVYLQGD